MKKHVEKDKKQVPSEAVEGLKADENQVAQKTRENKGETISELKNEAEVKLREKREQEKILMTKK